MDVELYKANHEVKQICKVAAFTEFSQWLWNSCYMQQIIMCYLLRNPRFCVTLLAELY